VTEGAILERVRAHLAERAAAADDPHVTVGERVVLVDLRDPADGRLAGLAHRPPGEADGAWPSSVEALTSLSGADDPFSRAVGVATLNAISRPLVDWRVGDPMASLSADVDVVATVGLFRPAFEKFSDVEVRVVERDPPDEVDAPPGVRVRTYGPADAAEAFDGADVCFVTGSTLLYGGLETYLDALSAASVSPVVLVGATASHWPRPAFDAGVDVVAGARVDDPERVRRRVEGGECATDLHDEGVTKVFVAAEGETPKLSLPEEPYGESRTTETRP